MDLPTALLRDLLQFNAGAALGDEDLDGALADLVTAIRSAVPSYRGMIITIFDGDQPITLARLSDEDDLIVTSLRLPFASLDAGNRTAGRIVFWAARPGAFVDLAADLGHALNAPTLIGRLEPTSRKGRDGTDRSEDDHVGADHRGGHASIVLDADFPPHTPPPGLSGLDQLSTINRADRHPHRPGT